MEYTIPIIWGAYKQIEKLDFSFKGIEIIDTQSQRFREHILTLNSTETYQWDFVNNFIGEPHDEFDHQFAIIKTNPLSKVIYTELKNVFRLLHIIFPSDLQITGELFFNKDDDGIWRTGGAYKYDKNYIKDYPGELLYYHLDYLNEINSFIKLVFERMEKHNYLQLTIYHYETSYQASHQHLAYSSLYTALETIIEGGEELKYRLNRAVSILCGQNIHECSIISNNMKEFNKLRNQIVHGDSGFAKKVESYIEKLRSLVSRVIIELLIHDIKSPSELNRIFTEIGYNDQAKISSNWKKYNLNILVLLDIIKDVKEI